MKKQFVKTVISGKTYTIDRNANYDGWVDSDRGGNDYYALAVFGGMKNARKCLDTFIHECLHACDDGATEKLVVQTAAKSARMLWSQGLRYFEKCRPGRPSILPELTLLNALSESKWDELKIGRTASDIAAALIKVGYRLK